MNNCYKAIATFLFQPTWFYASASNIISHVNCLKRGTLETILDDVSYSCGASFEDIKFPYGLSIIIAESVCN